MSITIDSLQNLDIRKTFNIDSINKESEKGELGGSTVVDFTEEGSKKNNSKYFFIALVTVGVLIYKNK